MTPRRESDTATAAAFWDHHHAISEDPDFWMAHPLCRRAINRRVSQDERIWPLDFLYMQSGAGPFERLLSLGCGTGRLERSVRRLRLANQVEGIDGSQVSISVAQDKAREEGLQHIDYRVADLNRVELPRRRYDAVVFHQALHHVASIERLLQQIHRALRPNGLLFLDEWTGPSRFDWTEARLERARALFHDVPQEWRKCDDLRAPIEENDPSEAIRSSAILPSVRRLFDVVVERPYGGHIVSIVLPQLRRELIPADRLDELISKWLSVEEDDLAESGTKSCYAAVLARRRGAFAGIVGNVASFAVRARLFARYRLPVMNLLRLRFRTAQRPPNAAGRPGVHSDLDP